MPSQNYSSSTLHCQCIKKSVWEVVKPGRFLHLSAETVPYTRLHKALTQGPRGPSSQVSTTKVEAVCQSSLLPLLQLETSMMPCTSHIFLLYFLWGKEYDLFGKPADREDGRLISQNRHLPLSLLFCAQLLGSSELSFGFTPMNKRTNFSFYIRIKSIIFYNLHVDSWRSAFRRRLSCNQHFKMWKLFLKQQSSFGVNHSLCQSDVLFINFLFVILPNYTLTCGKIQFGFSFFSFFLSGLFQSF